ncbi:MAG: ribosome recycling factor [Erysipelothrix sp.]|nr:ribosome recycling factor [Erysipelothrix sp.]
MSKFANLASSKMEKAIENFESNLSVIRTGRPNPNMISGIEIDYYGAPTPLNQMGHISVVEGTQLVVKLFDPSQLKAVERAINAANIGLNAQNDGTVVRMVVPALTEATRKDLTKDVNKLLEETKVVIRNERRDVNDLIKKDEELREDDQKRELENVQKETDNFIKRAEEIADDKNKEIMSI